MNFERVFRVSTKKFLFFKSPPFREDECHFLSSFFDGQTFRCRTLLNSHQTDRGSVRNSSNLSDVLAGLVDDCLTRFDSLTRFRNFLNRKNSFSNDPGMMGSRRKLLPNITALKTMFLKNY